MCRQILHDLQTFTVANQNRLMERKQHVPTPPHLCLRSVIALKDFDLARSFIAMPEPTEEAPICDRQSVFGVDLYRIDSSIPAGYSSPVPIVLQIIAKGLELYDAYNTVGIFRIAPGATEHGVVRSFLEKVRPRQYAVRVQVADCACRVSCHVAMTFMRLLMSPSNGCENFHRVCLISCRCRTSQRRR